MTNPPRAGRCLAVLIAAWALAAANLVGEAGAEEIDRPTFTIDVPDSWVEDISMATDWFVWLDRSRSEEHTSELQSLMRISYSVFCLKKKKTTNIKKHITTTRR